jgi:endoglucanase
MRLSVFLLLAAFAAQISDRPAAGQAGAPPAAPAIAIKVDQVGYLTGAPKVALVAAESPASDFTVRRAAGGAVVFRGKLSAQAADADTGDKVQAADFSAFKTGGKYYVDVPGVGKSWEFSIGPDVYSRAFYLAVRAFYGQRCGIAVDLAPDFPAFKHAACHLEGAWHASSGKSGPRLSGKGWHDAGDYGRYTVNSGITTGTLLWAWEMFSGHVKGVKLNIPESGNKTPDILNEIKWNLDWMLSMQDEDGGVWHKQTSAQFCGFIMPEKDTLVSYVIGTGKEPFKSSCATADLAAVMAIAARVYKPFQPEFAAECLRAARKAFAWVEKYPNVTFNNPQGVGTGGYGDGNCSDEHLWAAAELWRTSGESDYEKYFLAHYGDFKNAGGRGARGAQPPAVPALIHATNPQGWGNVANLGLWTYVLGKGKDAAAVGAIRDDSLKAADEIVRRTPLLPYHHSMTTADYIWGSNAVAANYGMQLLVANAFKPNPRYLETALDNLHYILGRNTFSLSWVTQLGANPYKHPHHRPSGADGIDDPWPGMLSGGPNRSRQDPDMTRLLPAAYPPAKGYVDIQGAYACNEIAINWQAPLVFLLAGALK